MFNLKLVNEDTSEVINTITSVNGVDIEKYTKELYSSVYGEDDSYKIELSFSEDADADDVDSYLSTN